jgi:hypothetical protein
MIEWTKTISGSCETLGGVPAGATIESVNDVACLGICESCEQPILEGQKYASDEDGILICSNCMANVVSASD